MKNCHPGEMLLSNDKYKSSFNFKYGTVSQVSSPFAFLILKGKDKPWVSKEKDSQFQVSYASIRNYIEHTTY